MKTKWIMTLIIVALLAVIGVIDNMNHKDVQSKNITVQEFIWNSETDYTSVGKVFKVINVNDSEDYVWLDEGLLKKDNVSIVEGDTVKVTFNHDDAVRVSKVDHANVIYTVDKVNDDGTEYHAVNSDKSVTFGLDKVDGMITGVGDKVSVSENGVVTVE